MAAAPTDAAGRRRVLVVGAGPRFLSGISYYTHRLAGALAEDHRVSVLLMRRLLPRRLYPGKVRVGAQLVQFRYPAGVETFDGLDWIWGLSAVRALRFLRRQRPEVVVLQWWTGTVLHSYLLLAVAARLSGATVVLEAHEAQDVGELGVPFAGAYVRRTFPLLLRLCRAVVVHSAFDADLVASTYHLGARRVVTIPHGPYTLSLLEEPNGKHRHRPPADGPAADAPCRLLYFGVIRPFKGVEDLLDAFGALGRDEAESYRLTVVGETWEGWTRPGELIAEHPHRDLITFINRYVRDDEVTDLFSAADAVVLPYHRSSSSGPLLIAIGNGLPVLVTSVGGLIEAAQDYEGAVFVPPADPRALREALPALKARTGRRYTSTASWETTRHRYDELFRELDADRAARG